MLIHILDCSWAPNCTVEHVLPLRALPGLAKMFTLLRFWVFVIEWFGTINPDIMLL